MSCPAPSIVLHALSTDAAPASIRTNRAIVAIRLVMMFPLANCRYIPRVAAKERKPDEHEDETQIEFVNADRLAYACFMLPATVFAAPTIRSLFIVVLESHIPGRGTAFGHPAVGGGNTLRRIYRIQTILHGRVPR
jgi:hypothetical protein